LNATAPRSLGSRAAGWALLAAWLLLLGLLGAAIGYVMFLPERQATQEPVRALALPLPEPEPEPEPETTQTAEATAPEAPPAEPSAEETEQATEAPVPPVVEAPRPESHAAQEPTAEAEAHAGAEAAPETPAETQEAALPRAEAPLAPPEILPPWQRNAQPFEAPETRPRVAIVLVGMGLSSAATEAAIRQLPGPVSLSFSPYSRRLNEWIALARVNGHEVLLDLPMEPTSYPDDDPGPQALLTALSPEQNLARLDWALRRATGFVGVTSVMGSRFLASEEHLTPILNELKSQGLLFLDSRASEASVAGPLAQKLGLANAVNDRFLDLAQASRVAIDARLVQLERIARSEGYAVAIGQPYPVTIERLQEWAAGLEARGLVLAPLSTVAAARVARQTAARESGKQ